MTAEAGRFGRVIERGSSFVEVGALKIAALVRFRCFEEARRIPLRERPSPQIQDRRKPAKSCVLQVSEKLVHPVYRYTVVGTWYMLYSDLDSRGV